MATEYGKRLKTARLYAGFTQVSLSKATGIAQSTISTAEREGNGSADTSTYARACGVDAHWLATGEGDMLNTNNNVEPIGQTLGEIPLISWVRAGEFCESPDNFQPGDAEEYLPRPLANMGPNTFALKVMGDSMDVPGGYREGEIVYVDPDREPQPGKDVVARAASGMTLKRYKVDEEGPYLLQLNGNKIIRPPPGWTVCGVVVFSGFKR